MNTTGGRELHHKIGKKGKEKQKKGFCCAARMVGAAMASQAFACL
jgi:hypothetical protein